MTQLIWLRNDLRLDDNPSLYCGRKNIAAGQSLKVIYCVTPGQWQSHNEAAVKLGFRGDLLLDLSERLAALGFEFELLKSENFNTLPDLIADYCRQHKVTDLWFNRECPLDEVRRDQLVEKAVTKQGVQVHALNADLLIAEPLCNQQSNYYKVFTPWYRAWLGALQQSDLAPWPEPEALPGKSLSAAKIASLPGSDQYRSDLWPASEKAAQNALQKFCEQRMTDYEQARDFPAANGTSLLSPYLASGVLGLRRCLQMIQQTSFHDGVDWRDSVWLRELGWREFYRYLMVTTPRLCRGEPFRLETESIRWEHNPEAEQAWQQGQTGYPIIDAAMRQLQRTGWMHNRLRMLVASFYTKLLLLDWRGGERFFMEHLLDGDFASNNGGWQWSASTGCDASPWFRIFNPYRQSEKFDPKGAFIRKLVPELATLDDKSIHDPSPEQRKACGYPSPVVDYRAARERVLARFKENNSA